MIAHELPIKAKEYWSKMKIGFIAYESKNTDRRVLLDQHPGKPLHLHIGDREIEIEHIQSLDAAMDFFFEQVEKMFGELTDGSNSENF